MRIFRLWRTRSRNQPSSWDGAIHGLKIRSIQFAAIFCTVMLYIVYKTTIYEHDQARMERRLQPFDAPRVILKEIRESSLDIAVLPRGIVERSSDFELKPLWMTRDSRTKRDARTRHNLLAIPVGIRQRQNVDAIVQKFLSENFTVILFHYDGNVNGWHGLHWSSKAIHVAAFNQTKWWYAKRFLHPDVVSAYDYIFVWDEDLGVQNFHPGRYLDIMKSEGLEISQPALDPKLSDIHHKITIRKKKKKLHRRVLDSRGSINCTNTSDGPPCTGWVEGMAPVFSRSAWRCAWQLIQNDLVHGWGLDMKFGYCAQGDRTKNVGIIDSEFIVHQGIRTLGGANVKRSRFRQVSKFVATDTMKVSKFVATDTMKRRPQAVFSDRSEIRRQSTSELEIFRRRWDKAVKEDNNWVYPFHRGGREEN